MRNDIKQIWVTVEASDALDQIDTRIPKYQLASRIILASIIKKK